MMCCVLTMSKKNNKNSEYDFLRLSLLMIVAFIALSLMFLHTSTLYMGAKKELSEKNLLIEEYEQQDCNRDMAKLRMIHPSSSDEEWLGNNSYYIYKCDDCAEHNFENIPDIVVFRDNETDVLYSDNHFAVLGVCVD